MTKYIFNTALPIRKKGWKGNPVVKGRFTNGGTPISPSFGSLLKWKLGRNPQKAEKKAENYQVPSQPITNFSRKENQIIWLGHASFWITINGVNLLTDPCFFDSMGLKRQFPIPCSIDKIVDVDYLLVSHDHRDHLDIKTLEHICGNNPKIELLLPLKANQVLSKKLKAIPRQEAGWYQSYKLSHDIRITFLPAEHWGRRGPFDFNQSLWGSFLIEAGDKKIFFAGDTASNNQIFKDIRQEFGDMDICLLPIGAYAPKFIMDTSHVTPEEAAQIFEDLGGKLFIPMHYGTFDLSNEPLGEPIKRLKIHYQDHPEQIRPLVVGETFEF